MTLKTQVVYDPTTTPTAGLITSVWQGDDSNGLPAPPAPLATVVLIGSVPVNAFTQRVDPTLVPPALVAWIPPNSPVLTRLAFILRFTSAERQAIKASANASVQDGLDILSHVADVIDLTSTPVINWMNLLVAQTLITQARHDIIMTP